MKTKKNFRARIMKYAWQLWRVTRRKWRVCMIKAWELYRLARAMMAGVVSFYYQKADGSIRKARGTLAAMPGGAAGGRRSAKSSCKTMNYFDVDKNAFRSFRIENLICVIG